MFIARSLIALLLLAPFAQAAASLGGKDDIQVPVPRDAIADWTWVESKKGEHWYARTQKETGFNEAEGEALLAGGHLATLETESEGEYLAKLFGQELDQSDPDLPASMWIGLRRRVAQDPYQWTSGAEKIKFLWAEKEQPSDLAKSAWASLYVEGPNAGSWHDSDKKLDRHFGIIEIDFDPGVDPLVPSKKSQAKSERGLHEARLECILVADEEAQELELEQVREELASLRKAKAEIIHAKPQPSSAETRAASEAVQDWIELKTQDWIKKNRPLRIAIGNYEKARLRVAKGQQYGMTERAARVDIFCSILNQEQGWQTLEVRALNRRVAIRSRTTQDNFDIVSWTNEHRQVMGIPVLLLESRVTYGAQVHADDMAELGFFAHDSPVPGHGNFRDRCKEAGYSKGSGENLHMGGNAGIGSVQGWIGSPGHHSNMLQEMHGTIGPGITGRYSVQVFGARAQDRPSRPLKAGN